MKKTVAIITQPLTTNYGGLLQNWALQQVLKDMGFSPITFDQTDWNPSFSVKVKLCILRMLRPRSSFEKFIRQNIIKTRKSRQYSDFERCDRKYKPYAYIVGSDQVWRPKYNKFLDASFLSFTDNSRKIAYAASFGTDICEFSKEQCEKYSAALAKFTAISVREAAGVTLCRQEFNAEVTKVLDPTLLLTREKYQGIMPENDDNNHIFSYILDNDKWKCNVVGAVCTQYNLPEVPGKYDKFGFLPPPLSVEQWLSELRTARFVVCDSFHGLVFSLLMHRPFIVLANKKRGNERLTSLLSSLGLEGRLVDEGYNFDNMLNQQIDWTSVDEKLDLLRKESISFLTKALN